MAIELRRPSRIRSRPGGSLRALARRAPHPVLETAARLLLVGIAIGVLLVTWTGLASMAVVGVIALGAALTGWER